jgi:hypothetical protein
MVLFTHNASKLSVNAVPFHPSKTTTWSHYDPMNICIYNDGAPSLTFVTEKDRYDILHGIDDEALDDVFPPDAVEAYELELAEAFVSEMAILAMLEEREEQSRQSFAQFEKRWEVRRAAGPSGRPRPAMHLIIPVNHNVVKKVHRPTTTALAFHDGPHRRSQYDQYSDRSKNTKRMDTCRIKNIAPPPRPIVQHRKNS